MQHQSSGWRPHRVVGNRSRPQPVPLQYIPWQGQQVNNYARSKPEQKQITQVLFHIFSLSTQEETGYIKYSTFFFLLFFCFYVFLLIAYCPRSLGSVPSFLLQTDFNQALDLKAPKQPTKNVFQYAKFEKSQ